MLQSTWLGAKNRPDHCCSREGEFYIRDRNVAPPVATAPALNSEVQQTRSLTHGLPQEGQGVCLILGTNR